MVERRNTTPRAVSDRSQADYFSQLACERGTNESDNVDKFVEIAPLLESSDTHPRVLECGAGTGLYTRYLLKLGYRVTAVDLSADALAVNVANAQAAGFGAALKTMVGDFVEVANQLPGEFDQVIFIKVLHHFSDLDHIQSAMASAVTCMAPNGRAILFEPNGRNPMWRIYYSLTKDRVTGRPKWHYEKNTTLIREKNLRDRLPTGVTAEFHYHYVIPAFLIEKAGWLKPALERANKKLARSPMANWAANLSCRISRIP